MGLIANYMMIDEETLDDLMKFESDELVEEINNLEELEVHELYCMDKLWDGLHFLLTDVSASEPIEGNPLSEAVIGVHVFDSEDFVGCTEYTELSNIITALKAVDLEKLKAKFDPTEFDRAEIYPKTWTPENKDSLWNELLDGFNGVLKFYQQAESKKQHVIISIF